MAPEIPEDADASQLSMGSTEDYPAEEVEGDSEDDVPVIGAEEGDSW